MSNLLIWPARGRGVTIDLAAQFRRASMPKSNSGGTAPATRDDITGVLGDIDPAEVLAILSLRPTFADLEQALVWLEGDPDVFGAGEPVQGVASEIIAILANNEEEEPPRAG